MGKSPGDSTSTEGQECWIEQSGHTGLLLPAAHLPNHRFRFAFSICSKARSTASPAVIHSDGPHFLVVLSFRLCRSRNWTSARLSQLVRNQILVLSEPSKDLFSVPVFKHELRAFTTLGERLILVEFNSDYVRRGLWTDRLMLIFFGFETSNVSEQFRQKDHPDGNECPEWPECSLGVC